MIFVDINIEKVTIPFTCTYIKIRYTSDTNSIAMQNYVSQTTEMIHVTIRPTFSILLWIQHTEHETYAWTTIYSRIHLHLSQKLHPFMSWIIVILKLLFYSFPLYSLSLQSLYGNFFLTYVLTTRLSILNIFQLFSLSWIFATTISFLIISVQLLFSLSILQIHFPLPSPHFSENWPVYIQLSM